MADWVTALPAFLAAATILIVPGAVVMIAGWGWRRPHFLLFAPAVSVTLSAVASVVAPVLGMGWSPLPLGIVTVVTAAVAFFVGRWSGPPRATRVTGWGVAGVVGALAAAGAIVAVQLGYVFVGPHNISQTFDAIVHLNTVAYAVDTHNASAFHIGDTSDIPFYPNGWHSLVALSAVSTGAPVAVAVNATNIAVGAIAWPASVTALVWSFFPRRASALVVSAALSTGFGAFPILLFWFGVLYPNATAYAILPAGVAAVWLLCRMPSIRDGVRTALLLVALCAGIGLSHPNAFLGLFAFGAALAIYELARRLSSRRSRPAVLLHSGAIAAIVLVGIVLWRLSRTGYEMSRWGPWQSTAQAAGEALFLAPRQFPLTLTIAILVLLGIATALLRRRWLFVLFPFGVASLLFVLVSGTGVGNLVREFLTNPWYNDSYRLAALLPAAGIPVAVLGALTVIDGARRAVAGVRARRLLLTVGGVVATCVVFAVGVGPNVVQTAATARGNYVLDSSSALLTAEESALLARLDEHTSAADVVAVNPWTGGSLAYALANRDVTEKHVFGVRSADEEYLDAHLSQIESDPRVCAAVRTVGATYVLDFGDQNVFNDPASGGDRAGLNGLAPSSHLVLVDSEGAKARLFRIEGC
ncbi:DUF6541 family protein [Microbacterium binotii]|uniref:Glycosyltransferase n=1 Tax=Microbacterium binotii TaxID=462710 RepID=A0ABN3P5G4_9MICO